LKHSVWRSARPRPSVRAQFPLKRWARDHEIIRPPALQPRRPPAPSGTLAHPLRRGPVETNVPPASKLHSRGEQPRQPAPAIEKDQVRSVSPPCQGPSSRLARSGRGGREAASACPRPRQRCDDRLASGRRSRRPCRSSTAAWANGGRAPERVSLSSKLACDLLPGASARLDVNVDGRTRLTKTPQPPAS